MGTLLDQLIIRHRAVIKVTGQTSGQAQDHISAMTLEREKQLSIKGRLWEPTGNNGAAHHVILQKGMERVPL